MAIISKITSLFKKKEQVPQAGKPMVTSAEVSSGKVSDTSRVTVVPSSASVSSVSSSQAGNIKEEVRKISSGRSSKSSAPTQQDYLIQPSTPTTQTQSVVSASEYTGVLPGRATLSVKDSVKGTFSAIGNLGLIGQQGLGAYGSGVIGSFYAYPGRIKAETIDPSTIRGGTTYLPSSGTGIYNPSTKEYDKNTYVYQDPFYKGEQTYFEVSEGRKKDLWEGAGLKYEGQPTELIGRRVAEDVSKSVTSQLQQRINLGEFGYGEEGVEKAKLEFTKIALPEYEQRLSGLGTDYSKQLKFEQGLYTPLAVTRAQAGFKIAETGALIGATAFGGAGLTLAASTYLGIKTFKSGVQYKADFGSMTTGQKVLGGAGLLVGAGASAYGFKIGVDKYYAGWQKTITDSLKGSKGRIAGQEVFKVTDDLGIQTTFIKAGTFRTSGVNAQQLTMSGTSVYKTGADSVGFFQKGMTVTKVFSPRYNKFITTKETFSQAGNIPKVSEDLAVSIFKGGSKFTSEPTFTGGFGTSILTRGSGDMTRYGFISASRLNQQGVYDVFGGANLYRASKDVIPGVKAFSTGIRSRPYDFGKIKALTSETGDEGVSFISFSGTGAKTSFAKTFGSSPGIASVLTQKAQTILTPNLGLSSVKGFSSVSGVGGAGLSIKTSTKTSQQSQTIPRIKSQVLIGKVDTGQSIQGITPIVLPRVWTSSRGRTRQDSPVISLNFQQLLPASATQEKLVTVVSQNFRQGFKEKLTGRTGFASSFVGVPFTPSTFTPTFGGGGFGFALPKVPLSFNAVFGAPLKTKRSYQYSPNLGSILSGYKAPKITGGIRRAEYSGFIPRPVITGTRRKASKRKK